MTVAVETCERAAVYVIHQAGVDQIRVVLSLAGESAPLCDLLTDHDWRSRGIPNMRFVGRVRQAGFKKVFDHLLGDAARLLYHRDSRHLHVDIHFARLASVDAGVQRTREIIAQLARQGFESSFPVRVARADFTGDVIFSSSAHFRCTASAFRAMLCERGRVMEPFRSSTLYLNASAASKTKRLGRIYDKGLERAERANWTLPQERYMRIEAEQVWDADRPCSTRSPLMRPVESSSTASGGRPWNARAERRPRKAADDTPTRRRIKANEYERLYTFLDHCRMGIAPELYADIRDTYYRRAREARALGLEIPGLDGEPIEDLEPPLDVRELVHEISRSF